MSGVEIVGLLASVSQLAGHALNIYSSISDIYHKIQNAPRVIQEHAGHIRQLINTAELICEHKLLQTDCINSQIISTLDQARLLSAILEKVKKDYLHGHLVRRYWKILKGDREREILASLKRLEQERSALLLCISIAHTDLLGTIQDSVAPSIVRLPAPISDPPPERKSLEQLVDASVNCFDSTEIKQFSFDSREGKENAMDRDPNRGESMNEFSFTRCFYCRKH